MLSKINHRIIVAVMLHFVCDKASSQQAKLCGFFKKTQINITATKMLISFLCLPYRNPGNL